MQPTYTPPIPVIGNHPADCSCTTCVGGRKRLLASPFVQRLISELSVLHEQFYKATSTMPIFAPELEKRVLTLTDELATAKEDNGVLTRALNESREIAQGREKQLRASEQKLSHFTSRANTAEAFLDTVKAALDCKDPAKLAEKAQKLQGDLGELKAAREGYETGRREIQARLEQLDSQLTAIWMALPLSWRPADRGKLSESTRLFANGWEDLVTRQRETEEQLTEVQATLRLANDSIQSKQSTIQQLRSDLAQVQLTADERSRKIKQVDFEGKMLTIVTGILCGVISYIVGRWAR